MKPEKQRICIAEFCGWKHWDLSPQQDRAWMNPSGVTANMQDMPDYLNDLNASIPLLDRLSYECWKIDIQRRSDDSAFGPWFVGVFKGSIFVCAQAETLACVICEVFLKVYGRWTDETPH